MWADPELRATVLDIREMDRVDGRVKKIHARISSATVKGGLALEISSIHTEIIEIWKEWARRLHLHRQEKLESHARGAVMEGNLALQWVLDKTMQHVVAVKRMPAETIKPLVGENGSFVDPRRAYEQINYSTGQTDAVFPQWQLTMVRLAPDNYDDFGSLGRPLLDASRTTWQQLRMVDEATVIRRHARAPQRKVHELENVSDPDFQTYKQTIENDKHDQTSDYFIRGKGTVRAIEGDANLDQIADIVYLLDTFFSGSPVPKGLIGYTEGLSRDILEDIKREFFDEIDALQDTVAWGYEQGFRLELLLRGKNPDAYDFAVKFAERRTETRNHRADYALKLQALGVPDEIAWREAGLDTAKIRAEVEAAKKRRDPYPGDDDDDERGRRPARVSVTPGNGRKGDSSTDITTRSTR